MDTILTKALLVIERRVLKKIVFHVIYKKKSLAALLSFAIDVTRITMTNCMHKDRL